ncbi:MAG: hypothetical protein GKR94_34295 [Gammaproteobacteria bacterium]|nr:hypothetical protein [Gammaproteobacteria bacterium]
MRDDEDGMMPLPDKLLAPLSRFNDGVEVVGKYLVLAPPFHPYTQLLINSVPELCIGWLEDTLQKQEMAAGIARGVEITAVGCPFYRRCPVAIEGRCKREDAPIHAAHPKHFIACHRRLNELTRMV